MINEDSSPPESGSGHWLLGDEDRPLRVLLSGGERDGLAEAMRRGQERLIARGCEVTVEPTGREDLSQREFDLLVVFGGDGAILSAARRMKTAQRPLIGVRFGRFGFMAELGPGDFEEGLDRLVKGEGVSEERMMMRVSVRRDDEIVFDDRCLNDSLLTTNTSAKMVQVSLYTQEEYVATYHADGVIVATPVGSTGHSLAAGGPIVPPIHRAFIVTPICPHALANRPLILPTGDSLEFRIRAGRETPTLTLDGQVGLDLKFGDRVCLEESEVKFFLYRVVKRSYFETLRTKFGWGGSVELSES